MSPIISLVFDILIFCALAVTIFYSIRLSRQFSDMQDSRKAFEDFIKAMNVATAKAENVIKEMRETVDEEGEILQDKISRAKGIEEELEIIIQAGDSLANRLEQASSSKSASSSSAQTSRPQLVDDEEDQDIKNFKSKAEIDLLQALKTRKGK